MHGQNHSTPQKSTTTWMLWRTLCWNMNFQLQKTKEGWVLPAKVSSLKPCFSTQNQSCMAKFFRRSLPLMLENFVSKYEVPTLKWGWVRAVQRFELKNVVFQLKITHAWPKLFDTQYFSCWKILYSNIKTPLSKRGLSYGCPKFWAQNRCFSTQNQSCMVEMFCRSLLLILENIVEIWSLNSKMGLSYGCLKFWVQNRCFWSQNQSCIAKMFWHPKMCYSLCWRTLCPNMKSQLQKGAELWLANWIVWK